MGDSSEVGFDRWPFKGLLFLEKEHSEMQVEVTPYSLALRDCGTVMVGQADFTSSPWPLHTAPPAGQNWTTLLIGHALRTSSMVKEGAFIKVGEGRCKRWQVPGEFLFVITMLVLKKYMDHPNLMLALEVICGYRILEVL